MPKAQVLANFESIIKVRLLSNEAASWKQVWNHTLKTISKLWLGTICKSIRGERRLVFKLDTNIRSHVGGIVGTRSCQQNRTYILDALLELQLEANVHLYVGSMSKNRCCNMFGITIWKQFRASSCLKLYVRCNVEYECFPVCAANLGLCFGDMPANTIWKQHVYYSNSVKPMSRLWRVCVLEIIFRRKCGSV